MLWWRFNMVRSTYFALALSAILPAAYSGQFTTIDCPFGTSTQAVSVNNHNWVVGTCFVHSITRSFVRMPNGVMHIFAVPVTPTFATAINDSGVVVGYYANE